MAVQKSRTRASDGDERPDNRLAFLDQVLFAGHRAAGQKEVVQCVWVYEHAIDFDAVRRFHHNLRYGLLARRIERSPAPFARHRWVVDRGPSNIEIVERARPRDELSDWADERSQLAVDPVWGPGWHLGVLPLTDGSTAVSLVLSHYLIDGLGLVVVLIDALLGNTRELGYPPPGSRTRRRAVIEDLRETAQDVPAVGRAIVAGIKQARGRRDAVAPTRASRTTVLEGGVSDCDEPVVVPGVTICIDLDDWDTRAKALGGSSNTLVAGFAAKLGERLGRRHPGDGMVTLQLPISERADGDTRAIAVSFARADIDSTRVTTDLSDARAAINQALVALRESSDQSSQLLPLTAFTPKWMLKRVLDAANIDPDRPVFCSNLGDVGSQVNRLDGTDADYSYARGTRQGVTRRWLERIGGQLNLLSLRLPDKIVIHVLAYQPGGKNTKPALRDLVAQTLAEFELIGDVE